MPKKRKQKKAPRHPGLAVLDFPRSGAVPMVVTKCHPWPIVPHLASLPNAPLHSTSARPPDGAGRTTETLRRVENAACGFSTGCGLVDNAARLSTLRITFKYARTDSPVRRVSGIGVHGVERHGCRESCDGPRTALRSVPLEHRWSERTRNAAKRNAGPDVGCVSSWLLLLAA